MLLFHLPFEESPQMVCPKAPAGFNLSLNYAYTKESVLCQRGIGVCSEKYTVYAIRDMKRICNYS